jgi:YaiO family outer membrane protein
LLAKKPGQPDALALKALIEDKRQKNQVSVSYLNITYNNPGFEPWHFGSVEYKRELRKCPLLARVNYGNVYLQDAWQVEIDAYPKLAPKTYMYLNSGYSPGPDVFPQFRGGAEIYQGLPKAFEASLGARYMHFKSADVMIYTAYLGKYYKSWWFSYRPYLVAPQGKTYFTHTVTLRRYFKDNNVYVSLNGIYGAAPFIVSFLEDITRVNAQRIGIDAQFRIARGFYAKPLFMYEYEEYYPGQFRNRFDAQLTLSKKF